MTKKLLSLIVIVCLCSPVLFAQGKDDGKKMDAQGAVYKAVQLDQLIKGKKTALEKERDRNFRIYENEYKTESDKLAKKKKDEFETTKEYNARLENERVRLSKRLQERKDAYLEEVYNPEKENKIVALEKELEELVGRAYDLPDGYYRIEIGDYNADGNYYGVTFHYYVRTDVNPATGKKNFVWDKKALRWEIEREKAKALSAVKKKLLLNCQASLFRWSGEYVVDKYEITIADPNDNTQLFSHVFYKNPRLNQQAAVTRAIPSVLDNYQSKTYSPTVPDLWLRDSGGLTGKVLRSLQKSEKLQILALGNEDVIKGDEGRWVQVRSLENGDEGWCFSYFLTSTKK